VVTASQVTGGRSDCLRCAPGRDSGAAGIAFRWHAAPTTSAGPTTPGSRGRWRWSRCWPRTRGSGPFASCRYRPPTHWYWRQAHPLGRTGRCPWASMNRNPDAKVQLSSGGPSQAAIAPIIATWAASRSRWSHLQHSLQDHQSQR